MFSFGDMNIAEGLSRVFQPLRTGLESRTDDA
jgi:hypothetical protein